MKKISKEVSEASLAEMCTDEFKNAFTMNLRSRYPLFYITTNEERRMVQFLDHYCRVKGYDCYLWNCYDGLSNIKDGSEVTSTSDDLKNNPMAILDYIISAGSNYSKSKSSVDEKKGDGVNGVLFILLDYFRFIEENPDIERRFKSISNLNSIVCTICTGPHYKSTDVIENLMPVIDFPLPNKKEIRHALYDVVRGAEKRIPEIPRKTKLIEEELINSVSGLTLMEAQTAFSKSLVAHHDWDLHTMLEEKKQIISKSGMLDYYDANVSMDDIGGLKNLTNWIKSRKQCFSQEAEDYGLQKPRGLLTIGMPGCGKSLVCKAISNAWNMPLLRLDFGKLFGSLVGDSEKNAREAIKQAEAIAPSILWIDEIEKAISGNASSGRSDGGTTSRVLSTFLTWMQEKTSPVFVVATANDHQAIPPEFLRAGRFDEIFFVDLPNASEREEIFDVLLRLRGIKSKVNKKSLASKSNHYSGAEIEKAIDNAMLKGFTDGARPIMTKDIEESLSEFKSLFEMRESDFEELREWADSRCRKANEKVLKKVSLGQQSNSKQLDLGQGSTAKDIDL
jgi:ATP-dependent 26S proteasome regulatory subunit